MTILEQLKANKFPYTGNLIHLFRGGSELHGAKLEGKQDEDWYGVYVESPDMVVGLKDYPHYVWSTAGDTEKNKPGDMDITLYSLRKWVKLACSGNPTCLAFMYAANTLPDKGQWAKVLAQKDIFLAKSNAEQFRGFAYAQLQRVLGEKGRTSAPVQDAARACPAHDVKAAMHVMRLLREGVELMDTGKITYPRPDRDWLIEIRSGKYSLEAIKAFAENEFADLDVAQKNSKLQDSCDRDKASQFLTDFYLNYWKQEDAQMNRILARGLNLACRWIAGHLTADERADGHPQWEAWRDQNVVKIAMIDLAIRAEDK